MKTRIDKMKVAAATIGFIVANSIWFGCSVESPFFEEIDQPDAGVNDDTEGVIDDNGGSDSDEDFDHGCEVIYTEDREPCQDRNPLRNLYFGDLHAHTRYSADAYLFKNRNYPSDAYLFARGAALKIFPPDHFVEGAVFAQLKAPLDFVAITDHSEFLGELAVCTNPQSESYDTISCQAVRGDIPLEGIIESPTIQIDPERSEEICGSDYSICFEALDTIWSTIKEMAEIAYDRTDACTLTTFIGYEYTGAPGGAQLHRNVIFRNANVPDRPISYYEENTLPGLWRALRDQCLEAGIGCDALAIPHNPNLSYGHAFKLSYPEGSTIEEQKELALLRVRLEPLVEIYQHKGSSECFNKFTSDEACGFENMSFLPCNGDGSGSGQLCAATIDYVREILAVGLGEDERIRVNPFKLGIIADTDTHNSTPGNTAEDTFVGHAGIKDIDALDRLNEGLQFSPGGLVGIWALENSRDALFESMRRRETFGTSGPRISVRFFGGWSYSPDTCDDNDFLEVGYGYGVPMGGTLPFRPSAEVAPVFMVKAEMDETPLQRIQIIKVWMDAEGSPQEQVFDVVGDPSNSATVDTETCETEGLGFSSLCARWIDPDFDASVPAAYYARVLENPTCRWSTYTCNNLPESERPPVCDEPRIIRERAWTSPIWYEP
jgi:hypothetical protein